MVQNRRRRKTKNSEPNMSNWSDMEKAVYRRKAALRTPIAEMGLSVRIINTLEDNNILLCCDLVAQTYENLMAMKNFGDKTLSEVRKAITDLGLQAPDWTPVPKEPRPAAPRGPARSPFSGMF